MIEQTLAIRDKLISQQQLEIMNLKETIANFELAKKNISNQIFGIGAPLNGNKLEFTNRQQGVFFTIARELDLQ